ncbi:hypothetical protein [Duganella sp. HH101]|uniref:hypothetical protein n=1 Tax=Duganella sp. HH101 TaxID=1781066 RepID=UPI0008932853|nr:hypothetical protein [Duganella sp. HH101]OFA04409.1 hypothetical protein DUGA2_19540 [Duganella sp. HH101]
MPNESGTCVLCGERRLLTGEHIFAAWIGRLSAHAEPNTTALIFSRGVRKIEVVDLSKRGGHKNNTVNVLCESCNSEWSSDIQQATRNILKPILDRKVWFISLLERKVIAVWASLFVGIRQYAHGAIPVISAEKMKVFYNSKAKIDKLEPFKGINVWMGSFDGDHEFSARFAALRLAEEVHYEDQPNTYICTFAFGNLIFITWGSVESAKNDQLIPGTILLQQFLRSMGMCEIWPGKVPFQENRPESLTDDDLISLLDAAVRVIEHAVADSIRLPNW